MENEERRDGGEGEDDDEAGALEAGGAEVHDGEGGNEIEGEGEE